MDLGYQIKKGFRSKREENRQGSYERKHDTLYKRHGGEKALFIIMGIIFVLFSISFIFPFVWVFFNALKTNDEFNTDSMAFPTQWLWGNFGQMFLYSSSETNYYNILQMLGMLKTSLLDNQKTWPTGLLRANIDSCIVEGMISQESRRMLASHFANHIVMLSRHYLQGGLSGVGIDNYEGGNFAAGKALAAGHPRIGWIGSLGSQDISRERYYGVCNCLAKEGMELSIEIWLDERAPLDTDMIDAVIAPQFSDDPAQRPTVWISSTDWLGAMVMLYFEKRNLFCPEDFSMICFDDTKIAEALVRRELTSVISPITRMAVGAVQMLACGWNGQLDDPAAWLYPFEYREGTTLKQYKR